MKYLRANVNEVQSVVAPCNMCCMAMYLSWFCLLSTLFWAFLGFSNSGRWKSLHFFLDERMASGLLHGTGSLSSWRNELGAISADIDPALCYSVTWFQNDISTYESSSPNTLWLQTVRVKTSLLSNRPAAPLLLLPLRLDLVKGILIASSTASHQIAALISFRLKWYEGKYVCNLKCFIEHQSSQNVYHMLLLGPSGHCLTRFFSSLCTNSTKQHYYTMYDRPLGLIWTPPLAFFLCHPFCRTLIFSFSFQAPRSRTLRNFLNLINFLNFTNFLNLENL